MLSCEMCCSVACAVATDWACSTDMNTKVLNTTVDAPAASHMTPPHFANPQLDAAKVARKLALTAAADRNGRARQYNSGLDADGGRRPTGFNLDQGRSRQAGRGLGALGGLKGLGGLDMNAPAAAGTEEDDGFGGALGEEDEEDDLEPGAATGFGALQLQTGRGMQQQKQRKRVRGLNAAAAAGDVGGELDFGGLQGFGLDDSQRSEAEDIRQMAARVAQMLTRGDEDR